jgi:hypothetical protein
MSTLTAKRERERR